MSGNIKKTELDYTNSLTNSHNEAEKAFNVIDASSLVPFRYGKIDLDYVTSGYGIGQIKTAKYYSNGIFQETKVICRGNNLGSAHKTTVNFVNKIPSSLAGRSFVVYDNVGAVNIWFNVDGANTAPVVAATYRNIEIPLLSTDNHELVAQKASAVIHADSLFISVYTSYYIIISSSSAGVRQNSYDINSSLPIRNTAGSASQNLNSTYWSINSALNANQYYVWYNVNGGGTDPAISGKTGIVVAITTTSTASEVAQSTKTALDATGKFITNISEESLEITNIAIGATTKFLENTSGFLIWVPVTGESRTLLATIQLTYNASDELSSAERL